MWDALTTIYCMIEVIFPFQGVISIIWRSAFQILMLNCKFDSFKTSGRCRTNLDNFVNWALDILHLFKLIKQRSSDFFFLNERNFVNWRTNDVYNRYQRKTKFNQTRLYQIHLPRNYNEPDRAIQHNPLIFAESNNYWWESLSLWHKELRLIGMNVDLLATKRRKSN